MNKLLTILALFGIYSASAQQDLHGRVISGDMVIPGIFVIDKRTGAETKTDGSGYFTLAAKPGDRIVVYGKAIEVREFIVTENALAQNPYIMEAEFKGTELDEVTVSRINPEKLGLAPKGQEQYTPAERRLKTATQMRVLHSLFTGGGIRFDPIINAINGRARMMKKNLAVETKSNDLEQLSNMFGKDVLIRDFAIPEAHTDGFMYYAVEDKECADALKNGNKEAVKLRLIFLAEQYLKLQKEPCTDC
nr:hypothetical protein [uncultured Flavobacterium sp.]